MDILTKKKVIDTLTKRYLKKLTVDCIELSPVIDDAFEIRDVVINNLKKLTNKG